MREQRTGDEASEPDREPTKSGTKKGIKIRKSKIGHMGGELEIKRFEATEFWKASTYVLQGGRGDAVRKAGPAEILELGEQREDVLHAGAYGTDPVREATGEQAADELAKRL